MLAEPGRSVPAVLLVMRRLTAIFVLILAVTGTLVPAARAAAASPAHDCCIRATHHCHTSHNSDSSQRSFHTSGSCNHDCCRAATTPQWANPQQHTEAMFAVTVDGAATQSATIAHQTELPASHSPRGPPRDSLA